mgnify:FL=1
MIAPTDIVRSTHDNERVSLRRATAIAQVLKEKGIKVRALTSEPHGRRYLPIATPDNTREPKNRRVEVSIR